MFITLQVLTILVVASACALWLAPALELPGKVRLDKETYDAVQPMYYPGFTIGGVSEPAGMLLTIVLCMTPFGSTTFWLTLVAWLGLLAQQAVYWFVTHPVNQFWVEGQPINAWAQVSSRSARKRLALRAPIGVSCATVRNIHTWRAQG
jgi:hypothetical protein